VFVTRVSGPRSVAVSTRANKIILEQAETAREPCSRDLVLREPTTWEGESGNYRATGELYLYVRGDQAASAQAITGDSDYRLVRVGDLVFPRDRITRRGAPGTPPPKPGKKKESVKPRQPTQGTERPVICTTAPEQSVSPHPISVFGSMAQTLVATMMLTISLPKTGVCATASDCVICLLRRSSFGSTLAGLRYLGRSRPMAPSDATRLADRSVSDLETGVRSCAWLHRWACGAMRLIFDELAQNSRLAIAGGV
jgi:hypothetical protein